MPLASVSGRDIVAIQIRREGRQTEVIVYMSLIGNTRKFVRKVDSRALEITAENCETQRMEEPFILIAPTYARESTEILWRFLYHADNRQYCRGIAGTGNRNFGKGFCYTAKALSHHYKIPIVHLFELQGSAHDVAIIQKEIDQIGTENE